MTSRFLLLGTDTDVGKTTVGAALCGALLNKGARVAACKPVETGASEHSDLARLRALISDDRLALINGIRFDLAAAPSAASRAAGIAAPTNAQCAGFVRGAERTADAVVVETCGGALTPMSDTEYVSDLAPLLPEYRVVLVAALRLGVLSHTFAAAHYLRSIGSAPWAVVLVDRLGVSPEWYRQSTQEDMRRHGLQIGAFIPFGIAEDRAQLAACVTELIEQESHDPQAFSAT